MIGFALLKNRWSINRGTNNKLRSSFLLISLVLLSLYVDAQIRVIDNKGTLSVIDTSKWVHVELTNDIYNKSKSKVGIGTSTPSTALDVKGELSLSGLTAGRVGLQALPSTTTYTLTLPATKATSPGQVLSSDTSGNLSWETPSLSGIISLGNPTTAYLKGATISGGELTLGLANTTNPGLVSIGEQTFAGNKIFSGSTTVFGSGEGETPSMTFIRGPQAGGNGIPGADMYIQASNGTGAGGSGSIIFQTGTVSSSSNPTISNLVNQTTANSNSHTLANYTVPSNGTNKMLMVQLNMAYTGVSASSVTYNGVALKPLGSITSNSNKMEIWYLVSPSTGTPANIVVDLSTYSILGITAMTWINVNQMNPFGPVSSVNNGYGTSVSLTPSSSLGQTVMDFLTTTTSPVISASGQSVLSSASNGSCFATTGCKVASAGATTMGYSFGGSNYGYMAFAIQSVNAGSTNALTDALKINSVGNTVLASGKSLAFTDGGTSTVSLAAPLSVTSNYTLKLPAAQGNSGQTLLNDGVGNLVWGVPVSGAITALGTPTGSSALGGSVFGNTLALSLADSSNPGLLSSYDWTTFNAKQNAITLTSTGTTGVATLNSNTLNIPNYSFTLPVATGSLLGGVKVGSGLSVDAAGVISVASSGTVNSVSTAMANNGVTATWANSTTTPALTIGLGAITPSSVNGLVFTALSTGFKITGGVSLKTLTVNNDLTLSGADNSILNIGVGGTLGSNAFTNTSYAPLASPTFTGTVTNNGSFAGSAVLSSVNGGTGVANGGTITLGGNLITSGAFATTLTSTATTNVTLPTSGTLFGTAIGSITSLQLNTSLNDKTGSGFAVFSDSPTFTGTPIATTQAFVDNSTAVATTAFVQAKIPSYSRVGSNAQNITTTLADITGLTFAATANSVYEFEAVLSVQSSSAAGNSYAVNYSGAGGATVEAQITGTLAAATQKTLRINGLNVAATPFVTFVGAGGILIKGIFTTGSNAGNFVIRHAKVTSGTSTVFANSFLKVTRIL